MRYFIEVDDNTQTGKSLLTVVRSMQKSSTEINIRSEKELDELIDFELGKAIEKKRTDELSSRSKIMDLLDR